MTVHLGGAPGIGQHLNRHPKPRTAPVLDVDWTSGDERADADAVGTYRQFCPIARGSEVLAERWTPVILRNLLDGCRTFNEIAGGAPGLSRSLLTKRLHELARAGLVVIQPKPDAHGSFYEPTPAGRAAGGVLEAIAVWAENWAEVRPEHSDPGLVLFSWCRHSLRQDRVPPRRLVVRFEFEQSGRHIRSWMLLEEGAGEICNFDPGFGDDLVVAITDPLTFTRWHLGLTSWAEALRSGGVQISGPPALRRALPTWNAAPELARRRLAEYKRDQAGLSWSAEITSPPNP